MIEVTVRVMDGVDTTNTPSDALLVIDVTDFDTDEVLGCTVVD